MILLLSITLKIPQIKLMLSKKTAKGVSIEAEFSDAIITALCISYNFHQGYAFTTYGENIFLLVQSIVVLYLCVSFGTFGMAKFLGILVVVAGLVLGSLLNKLPEQLYQYNMGILLIFSKSSGFAPNFISCLGETGADLPKLQSEERRSADSARGDSENRGKQLKGLQLHR